MSTAVFGAPEWWARSGRTIKPLADGTLTFQGSHGYLAPRTAMDAEEYFLAKRDADLGRWRCPTDLDWVAREGERDAFGRRTVVVFNERTFEFHQYNELVAGEVADAETARHRAARTYFEAHPERKPWEDAKPGEAWVLEVPAGPVVAVRRFDGGFYDYEGNRLAMERVSDARRIYPEAGEQ